MKRPANNALQQTVSGVTPLAGPARDRWVPHGGAQGARHPARCLVLIVHKYTNVSDSLKSDPPSWHSGWHGPATMPRKSPFSDRLIVRRGTRADRASKQIYVAVFSGHARQDDPAWRMRVSRTTRSPASSTPDARLSACGASASSRNAWPGSRSVHRPGRPRAFSPRAGRSG